MQTLNRNVLICYISVVETWTFICCTRCIRMFCFLWSRCLYLIEPWQHSLSL